MAAFIARKHSGSSCHPVVGIAFSLFPVLTQIGYYYRRVVETKQHSQEVTNDLRRRLLDWNPEDVGTPVSWLIRLAECYRDMGDIMLYQAQRLSNDINPVDTLIFLNKVLGIVDMIDSIPSNDPMINTLGPMLLIAGSELPPHYEEQRSIVRQASARLISFSKIPTYRKSIELVEEVWRLRSESTPVSWLELMLEQGFSLGLA